MRHGQTIRPALLAALLAALPLAAQAQAPAGGTSFYDSGRLKQKVTLLPNGRDRIAETYHENGQLMNRITYHGQQIADGE